MKLIPFNLERALAGEPVITRDGRQVKRLTQISTSTKIHSILAWIGKEYYLFDNKGKHDMLESNDLFMVSEVMEGWFNVYSRSGRLEIGPSYITKKEAEEGGKSSNAYIKTIKITGEL
jgi:hypothetical protein